MNVGQAAAEAIQSGRAILGIELGSTRIKASLIAPDTAPLASGSHAWENRLKDGVWTYAMEDVWNGLAASVASLGDSTSHLGSRSFSDRAELSQCCHVHSGKRCLQPRGIADHATQVAG